MNQSMSFIWFYLGNPPKQTPSIVAIRPGGYPQRNYIEQGESGKRRPLLELKLLELGPYDH